MATLAVAKIYILLIFRIVWLSRDGNGLRAYLSEALEI